MFQSKIKRFLNETEAATAVEYAVMLSLIIGTCIAAILVFGGESGALWGGTSDAVGDAIGTTP